MIKGALYEVTAGFPKLFVRNACFRRDICRYVAGYRAFGARVSSRECVLVDRTDRPAVLRCAHGPY